jgi:hypothetical protein
MNQYDINTGDHRRTTQFRWVAPAIALFAAPWALVLSNAAGAWMTQDTGQDDLTAEGALALAAAHPLLDKWAIFAAMVGSLLLIPAVLGAMRLVRYRAARVGLIGGTMMIAGYVCYFALTFQSYATNALAQQGGIGANDVKVVELTQDQAFYVIPALLFVLGNIVGTFLLGLALIRAHAIPLWAGLCVVAWPVLHLAGGTWGEVAGSVVEGIGLAVVGVRLLAIRPASADTEEYARTSRPVGPT